MNPLHYEALQHLRLCAFGVGSWDKKFVRDVSTLGEYDLLTPRQEESVERLAYRYRKQLAAHGYRVSESFVWAWKARKKQDTVWAKAKILPLSELRNYWITRQPSYQFTLLQLRTAK